MAKLRTAAAPWGNRIVGYAVAEAGQLLGNPKNWRIHPVAQQTALDQVLSEVGFVAAVIVNKRTGKSWGRDRNIETIVDGHLRVQMAVSRGEETPVPVIYVDLDPAEEAVVLATLDPLSAMAGRDREKLDDLLQDVSTQVDLEAILHRERAARTVSFEATEPGLGVLVECETQERQEALLQELRAAGWTCRPSAV